MTITNLLPTETMRDRFTSTAVNLLDTNRRIVVLTAAIGAGSFHAARLRHPNRVIDVGIREQLLIGTAAGFALEGFRPIVHSYAPFLVERPYEQVKLDLSHQGVGAILVSIGGSFDAAAEGRTHQSPADVAILSALPDWTIYVPGHVDEAEALLRAASRTSGNTYLRLSSRQNSSAHPGSGIQILRSGSAESATVLAVGPMLDPALDATGDLDVTVAYTVTPAPLDAVALRVAATGTDFVVVEPYLEGTSAAAVTRALQDRPHRLLSLGVGGSELRKYGTPEAHAAAHGLDAAGLRRSIADFLRVP
jgi:transketolase